MPTIKVYLAAEYLDGWLKGKNTIVRTARTMGDITKYTEIQIPANWIIHISSMGGDIAQIQGFH